MAKDYFAPGVYVEEVPSAQQPIAGVGTNTAAFIGIVPDKIQLPVLNEDYIPPMHQETTSEGLVGKSQQISQQELDKAEKAMKEADKAKSSAERSMNAAKNKPEFSEKEKAFETANKAFNDAQTHFNNLSANSKSSLSNNKPYKLETFNLKVEPCVTKLCTNFTEYKKNFGSFSYDEPGDQNTHRALTHAVNGFFKNGGTRCFVTRIKTKSQLTKALAMIDSIDEVALVAAPGFENKNDWSELINHCDLAKDRFAILDCPEKVEGSDGELKLDLLNFDNNENLLPPRSKNAAYYFPYIEVVDPAIQLLDMDPDREVEAKYRGRIFVPPSGHIAGIYARTDEERGVHKAPANTAIAGSLNVKYYISHRKQIGLNPQGVNCIRNLNGNIVVYGARTIGGDMNGEWKYVNVRRVMLYLEESIDEGTQWVVFEPNDIALWGKVRRNVSAFLANVWRSGALFGSTPEEAFYVKCDAEINPPEVRDLGQVVIEIGVSIVRPAEFVIFRISQSSEGFSA